MKLLKYITELSSIYGKGITFVDIDETIFRTFAKIYVMKDGKIIKKLNNQEYNTYEAGEGETFDFREFRNAEMFAKTSIPIPQTVKRLKRMFQNIGSRGSKVVFLTARADFDNKEKFLQTFREHGIPIDNIYVERAGNDQSGPVASIKKKIVMKYLNTGDYRRVRLIDDDMKNLKQFLTIKDDISKAVVEKIKKKHKITGEESIPVLEFFALLVKEDGSLKRLT